MSSSPWGTVTERLARNRYTVDEAHPHIVVNNDYVRRAGLASFFERICPAHVYTERDDGGVDVEYAACLECGTCLALAPAQALVWHYPRSGCGIGYREG